VWPQISAAGFLLNALKRDAGGIRRISLPKPKFYRPIAWGKSCRYCFQESGVQSAPRRRPRFGQKARSVIRALTVAVALLVPPGLAAQHASPRVVKTRVEPAYPALALKYHLDGVVKLQVVVDANGHVKGSKVIGGNPLLVQSAQDAVKKWEFEPAKEETTEIIAITFQP
jgi:TonB family protein